MTENRHAAIVDAALDCIVSIDAEGTVVEFNRAAQETFGYSDDEAIGHPMVDLIVPPDFREAHRKGFAHHLATGEKSVIDQRIEIVAQRKSGEVFPIELTVTRSDHGPEPIFTAWVRDISDRHAREAEIKEASGRLAALIANLGSGVLVESADRRVALTNRELCEIFRLPVGPEELIGTECEAAAHDLAPLFAQGDFLDRIEEILERDEVVRGEEIALKDGRTLERDFVPAYVQDELAGRLWIYRDVTARVQASADLTDMRDAALEASNTKSRFLATMSHELRTPLTGLTGLIDLLRQADLPLEARNIVRMMDESADHMLSVIGDVLDISKIEAGMMEFSAAPFLPRDEIAQSISLFSGRAEEKGLTLTTHLDGEGLAAPVLADVVRIRQIIQNLVSNAVKFTDHGEISIGAEISADDGDGHRLLVSVRDTGIGLSEDEIANLFEPFIQGESSYARQAGGTGLGLAICRRLARLMGGDVSVTSEKGGGSEFRVCVPVELAQSDSAAQVVPSSSPPEALGGGRRVAIVEDSSINREVISRLVEGLGYEVVMASNGLEAVALARREPLDAILMDCQMPEMDGFGATAAIRRLDTGAAMTPIIAMTASALEQDREKCLDAGMDDFLSKPLRQKQLERVLSQWAGTLSRKVVAPPDPARPNEGAAVKPLALDELRSQLGDDAAEAIVRTFIDEATERVARLRDAAAAGDAETVRREAHTLKSACAALGAVGASESCEELELHAATGEVDQDLAGNAVRSVGNAIAYFRSPPQRAPEPSREQA